VRILLLVALAGLLGVLPAAALATAAALRIEAWTEGTFLRLAASTLLGGLAGHGLALVRPEARWGLVTASVGGLAAAGASVFGVVQAFANNRMNWWVAEPFSAMIWTAFLPPCCGLVILTIRMRRLDEGAGAMPVAARALQWLQGGAVVAWLGFWSWTWSEAVQDLQVHVARWVWFLTHG
jgi:hypothetical protein